MIEKMKRGPVGFLTVLPSGPPAMGKNLVQWFMYCVVISIFAAYLSGRLLAPGTAFLQVFRVVGTVAFWDTAQPTPRNRFGRPQLGGRLQTSF